MWLQINTSPALAMTSLLACLRTCFHKQLQVVEEICKHLSCFSVPLCQLFYMPLKVLQNQHGSTFPFFSFWEEKAAEREGQAGNRGLTVLAVPLTVRMRLFKFSLHRLFCKDKRNHCWWLKMQKVLIVIAWQSAKDMTGGKNTARQLWPEWKKQGKTHGLTSEQKIDLGFA